MMLRISAFRASKRPDLQPGSAPRCLWLARSPVIQEILSLPSRRSSLASDGSTEAPRPPQAVHFSSTAFSRPRGTQAGVFTTPELVSPWEPVKWGIDSCWRGARGSQTEKLATGCSESPVATARALRAKRAGSRRAARHKKQKWTSIGFLIFLLDSLVKRDFGRSDDGGGSKQDELLGAGDEQRQGT